MLLTDVTSAPRYERNRRRAGTRARWDDVACGNGDALRCTPCSVAVTHRRSEAASWCFAVPVLSRSFCSSLSGCPSRPPSTRTRSAIGPPSTPLRPRRLKSRRPLALSSPPAVPACGAGMGGSRRIWRRSLSCRGASAAATWRMSPTSWKSWCCATSPVPCCSTKATTTLPSVPPQRRSSASSMPSRRRSTKRCRRRASTYWPSSRAWPGGTCGQPCRRPTPTSPKGPRRIRG